MDKRYLWLLLIAVIVFLVMIGGINMFIKSAQKTPPLKPESLPAAVVINTHDSVQENSQKRQPEEPVYEQQIPKGQVLVN
jgi:flagellar basal body-associated protein FliL